MSDTFPGRAYLVCCDARTGSSLLAATLRATGRAGKPFEYFARAEIDKPWLRAELRVPDDVAFTSFPDWRDYHPEGRLGVGRRIRRLGAFLAACRLRRDVPRPDADPATPALRSCAASSPTCGSSGCGATISSRRRSRTTSPSPPTSGTAGSAAAIAAGRERPRRALRFRQDRPSGRERARRPARLARDAEGRRGDHVAAAPTRNSPPICRARCGGCAHSSASISARRRSARRGWRSRRGRGRARWSGAIARSAGARAGAGRGRGGGLAARQG